MKKRPSFKDFKEKALKDTQVKEEYDALTPLFEIKKKFINARLDKGLTQDEVAKKIGTSKSSISRLESLNNKFMPNISTLMKYAEALELRFNIGLTAIK